MSMTGRVPSWLEEQKGARSSGSDPDRSAAPRTGVAPRPHHSRAAGDAAAVAGAPGAAAPQRLLARCHPVAGVPLDWRHAACVELAHRDAGSSLFVSATTRDLSKTTRTIRCEDSVSRASQSQPQHQQQQQRVIVTGGMGLADAVAAAHHQQPQLSHLARGNCGGGDAAPASRRWASHGPAVSASPDWPNVQILSQITR